MNKLSLVVLSLICVTVFVECKKKDDKKEDPVVIPTTPTKTQQEYLSDTAWKITGLTSVALGDLWNNPSFIKPCNQDNSYYFRTNNTLTTYDTPTKCSASDPDSTSGPYKLIDNNKKIYLELKLGNNFLKDTTDVVQLDDKTMILNIDYSGIPGTITFKH